MGVSYKRLWKLLIDKDMTKGQLRIESGISTRALAKLGRNESVTTTVLCKICRVLNCTIDEIVEVVPDDTDN